MKPWILLDWNGTLLDDAQRGANVVNELLQEQNLSPIPFSNYLEEFGFPIQEFYKNIGFNFNKRSYALLTEDFMTKYHNPNIPWILMNDAISSLKKLQPHYNLAILSAYKNERLQELITTLGLDSYFQAIQGIEGDAAASKTDLILKFVQKHNITAKNACYVGDTLHDYEVAQEAQIPCALIAKGHQSKKVLQKATHAQIFDSLNSFTQSDFLSLQA